MKPKNIVRITAGITTLLGLGYALIAIHLPKSITKDDIEILKLYNSDEECLDIDSYNKEIKCIKKIQLSQLKLIKGTRCRGKYINIGSKKLLKENKGCCYDRSRLTEQALQYYGFQVRHVHLNHTEGIGYLNLLVPSTPSHAVTEVLTSRGWMGVDSNEPFILIDKESNPNTYSQAIESGLAYDLSKNFKSFYLKPTIITIGLYSRHGTFFNPYLPNVPEINFGDFFKNIYKIKKTKHL